MPHIHIKPGDHDFTAGAFIIRFDTPDPQLLLHMHKKHKTLMHPGGHIETNENVWQAVLREIGEETGYDAEQLEVFQPAYSLRTLTDAIVHPIPATFTSHPIPGETSHYHTDSAYAFATVTLPRNTLHADESQDLRWVTLRELRTLGDKDIIPNVREIGVYMMTTVLQEWHRVPLSAFKQ